MIIPYIVEENIFVIIVYSTENIKMFCYRLLENGKQMMKMPKKGEYVRLKNLERKVKSPFMIYADFESILVPEDNGKQNPEESYTNIKNMLLAVMALNWYVLMINLVNLLSLN